MTLADEAERILEQMQIKTQPKTDQHILNDAYKEFIESSQSDNRTKINKFIKIAAVAASVIIVFSVLITRYNLKAARPDPIYNALVRSGDFSICSYHPGIEEPYMEVWVSKSMDIKMFKKIEAGSVLLTLWDIPGNKKITSQISTNDTMTEFISKKLITELQKSMVKAFSMSLFNNMDEIPHDAKWSKLVDPITTAKVPNSTAYVLTWSQQSPEGTIIYYKWLMFVTRNTNTIRRTELYVKTDPNGSYMLDSYTIISYPEPEEIENVIKENFDLIRSDPQYRSTGPH